MICTRVHLMSRPSRFQRRTLSPLLFLLLSPFQLLQWLIPRPSRLLHSRRNITMHLSLLSILSLPPVSFCSLSLLSQSTQTQHVTQTTQTFPSTPVLLTWAELAGHWVDTTTHDFFMELVPRRNAATLLPLIQQYVLPSMTIWSDEWAAYNGLDALGCMHQTVNHRKIYVDLVTGVHTNHIGSRWNAYKPKFKAHFTVQRDFIPHIYTWRRTRQPDRETFSGMWQQVMSCIYDWIISYSCCVVQCL